MPIARILNTNGPTWVQFDNQDNPLDSVTKSASSLAALMRGDSDDDGTRSAMGARLMAPLEEGARIVCIGLNYRAHAAESGHAEPARPVVFFRTRESLVGPEEAMILPQESERFDWEGELAVVIGKDGRRIAEEDAMDHVLGYTCLNDGSIRDWQKHTSQFGPGKNFDNSGSIGPWIALAEDAGEPGAMQLTTRRNGTIVQQSGVHDLIFAIPALIAYVSTFMALRTGDIIATGTPSGVGGARKPPVFLSAGDEITVEISGIGTLRNPVIAD